MGEICLRCGGENIKHRIHLVVKGGSPYGPLYNPDDFFGNTLGQVMIEPILCDICMDCGEITRFYIENTDRKWE